MLIGPLPHNLSYVVASLLKKIIILALILNIKKELEASFGEEERKTHLRAFDTKIGYFWHSETNPCFGEA